ncbi:MAG: CHAT domain-containing protein [Cyanobacteria bacterium J06648_10]
MIQEFGISITAVGGDQYLVRTENVVKGVQLAEEKVRWPVAEWLEQTKLLMHDPLLGLLQGQKSRAIPTRAGASRPPKHDENTPELATLVQLGQTLHDELFKGQLHDSWVTAQGVAQNRQDLLRLRIGMKDSRLQQLPWEALHAGTRPLATGTDVIFSRYILNRRQEHSLPQVRPSTSSQALRILMVIASPDDQERLELKQEVHQLQTELRPEALHSEALSTGDPTVDVQLTILEQPGRAELTQALDRGNFHVLHYAGHSNLGNAGGDLYLVSRQTGLTERLSGEDLAGLLVNNGVKLAVFNSCRGGYSSSSEQGWQERNLAQALVNRGMPSVIAMTERIPDHVAITFTQLLYRNLKKGQSIDLSLNRTRQGLISAYGSHQFYWALPTLYMHPLYDGYLVRVVGDVENSSLLDSANDPFGDMFAEPGLAEIDLPARSSEAGLPASPPTDVDADLFDQQDAVLIPKQGSAAAVGVGGMLSVTRSTLDDTEPVSDRDLVINDDIPETDAAVENAPVENAPVSEPSADTVDIEGADIEGALSVPSDLEAPEGFYGEPVSVDLAVPTLDKPTEPEVPELVGERLKRSHTLNTKLLTGPGIAVLVLLALLGLTTVGWLRKGRSPAPIAATPTATSNLREPAQIEVALNGSDIDGAIGPAKSLIDQGKFTEVVAALRAADDEQQEDVVIAFFRGRAQWGLVKQGNPDFAAADAMRSWMTALESESDWMEITMALGFAQYEINREELALESWEKAVALADRQPDAKVGFFSDEAAGEYVLNARAGIAIASLALSKIEADPTERNRLINQAKAAYLQVINEAPTEFGVNTLGGNWLWLGSTIADWEDAKEELSLLVDEG